jgi:hypothetical protein
MHIPSVPFYLKSRRAWLAIFAVLLVVIYELHRQGRLWWCACGHFRLWAGDIWSAENSQQLLDPYSFTHLLHGFIFYWLLKWLLPRLAPEWQLWLAIAVEATWEMIENSAFIIDRYRSTTAALGYQGDTIVNSVGDILVCGLGVLLARKLGFRRSLAIFILVEIVLVFWIKDGLIFNIIMLLYPVDAIKQWQISR